LSFEFWVLSCEFWVVFTIAVSILAIASDSVKSDFISVFEIISLSRSNLSQ